jgi:peptide/nickel transport system permease protein
MIAVTERSAAGEPTRAAATAPPIRHGWGDLARRFPRRQPLGLAGLIVVLTMLAAAALADWIAPYDYLLTRYDAIMQAPSWAHWMGTDSFGRDLFSRILFGARTALTVGFASSLCGATLGLLIGIASAYFGGRIDLYAQRFLDVLLAFPLIILALAIVSIFGTGTLNVTLAITIPMIPRCAIVVRASALAIRELPYVDAARALGLGHTRIILRHMLPNVMAPYLILLTAFMGQAILLEASLSFLGLGVQEPVPAWGLMLQGGAESYAERAPWMAIFPGLAITISVLAFNLFGDALRDVLDPKMRV